LEKKRKGRDIANGLQHVAPFSGIDAAV